MKVDDFSRKTLSALAKIGVLTVNFYSANGGNKYMICTLMPEVLNKYSNIVEKSDSALRVFDLDIHEWRSFIPSNVSDVVWEPMTAPEIETKFFDTANTEFIVTLNLQIDSDLEASASFMESVLRSNGYLGVSVRVKD